MTRALSFITPTRLRWVALAAGLIAGGFICDGITEVGHHAFLILGGIATGYGIAKS
jgi:hypothetical protein